MDSTLLAVTVSALLGAAGGVVVPRLVASVPEPEPTTPSPDGPEALDPAPVPERQPAKVAYRDLARTPHLRASSVAVGAGAGALIGGGVGWDSRLDGWLLALPVLVALSFIDWNTRLLPNHLMWPLIWLTTVVVSGTVALTDSPGAAGRVLVLAAGAWVFYFVLNVINPSGIGFGDVRLSWVLGLLLASAGLAPLLAGLWLGFALGGLGGLMLGGVRGSLKRKIPFGPFMVLGALLGLLVGDWMLSGITR